jgi:Flp pilus assembly protein TadD
LNLRGRAAAIADPAEALQYFLEATQLVPTEPSAWEALAKVYAIVGDQLNAQKASARFEVLMSLAPQR